METTVYQGLPHLPKGTLVYRRNVAGGAHDSTCHKEQTARWPNADSRRSATGTSLIQNVRVRQCWEPRTNSIYVLRIRARAKLRVFYFDKEAQEFPQRHSI